MVWQIAPKLRGAVRRVQGLSLAKTASVLPSYRVCEGSAVATTPAYI